MARKRLETGVAGSLGTGDTIHNGGNKLRDNEDEFYHILGDMALEDQGEIPYIPSAIDPVIRPHAGGYAQRIVSGKFQTGEVMPSPVPAGTRWNIDTSGGAGNGEKVVLPKIGNSAGGARLGETVYFQDASSSWDGINPFKLMASSGDTILGDEEYPDDSNERQYRVVEPGMAVSATVTNESGPFQWGIKVEPMSGAVGSSVNITQTVTASISTVDFTLFDATSYDGMKLMIYIQNDDAISIPQGANPRKSISEVLLLNTGTEAYIDEYSIINSDQDFGSLVNITPKVVTVPGATTRNFITLEIEAIDPKVHVTIKSIETIKHN